MSETEHETIIRNQEVIMQALFSLSGIKPADRNLLARRIQISRWRNGSADPKAQPPFDEIQEALRGKRDRFFLNGETWVRERAQS